MLGLTIEHPISANHTSPCESLSQFKFSGSPKVSNGTKGKSSQSVITFASILLKRFNLPILLWDERFSSIGILKEMKKAGIKKNNIKKNIDAASATWILQSCLDTVNNQLVDENV